MLSNNDTPFDIPPSSPSQMVKSNEVIVLTRFPSAPSALTVHVGLDSHGGPQTSFRVDRDKMCLASLVWSHMLMPYGQFGESSNCDIPFPDDAPDAMEIVLVIIHSGPADLPAVYTMEPIIRLAKFAEKYQLASVLAPFIRGVLISVAEDINTSGNLVEHLLCIFCTFKMTRNAHTVLKSIIMQTIEDADGGLVYKKSSIAIGRKMEDEYIPCDARGMLPWCRAAMEHYTDLYSHHHTSANQIICRSHQAHGRFDLDND